jgi:hypothetical protein
MWPWGHLAAAFLVYAAYSRLRYRHRPTEAAAILVAFGSQLPDLVDKPLAWTVSVLPSGRSLAHSLLVLGPLFVAAYLLARRRDRAADRENRREGARAPLVVAVGIGAVVHSLTDGLYPVLSGEFGALAFLAWPVADLPEYEVEQSFAAHFAQMALTPEFAFELLLVALAFAVWTRQDYPGLDTVRILPARIVRSVVNDDP